jgi:MFS transporter, PAT family, beta-lactamase induction signal transducer AmpG
MTDQTAKLTSEEKKAKAKASFKAFFERSALIMFGLGFAAGMPNLLIGQTLVQTWMAQAEANLTLIGLLGLVTLPYALKFLWSPVVDKTAIPVLDKLLGRRRSWMLVTQIIFLACVIALAFLDPKQGLTPIVKDAITGKTTGGDATSAFIPFVIVAAIAAFAGATQDIAIDAWRIEIAREDEKLGVLTSNYQVGYRVAMFVSGALALAVVGIFAGPAPGVNQLPPYSREGWMWAFVIMAVTFCFGILATLLAPREVVLRDSTWVAPVDVLDRGIIDKLEWVVRFAIIGFAACVLAVGLAGKAEPLAWLVGPLYLPGAEAGKTATQAMAAALAAKPWGVYQQLGYAAMGLCLVVLACWKIPGVKTRPAAYFQAALGAPLVDFFGRYKSVATTILLFICLYRMSDFVLNLASSMYIQAGFDPLVIAAVQKTFGVIVGALSAIATGWMILRWGMFRCLMIGAFLQPLSNLSFILIALNGADVKYLYFAILIDNFSAMFAGTTFIVYLSMLTKDGFTATQYALFTSLYALPGKLVTALGGRIVESFARSAENGPVAAILPWFKDLPPAAFSKAGALIGVSGQAYAAGYTMFFFYTTAMGVFGIVLAFMVTRGKPRSVLEADTKAQAEEKDRAEAEAEAAAGAKA